MENIGAVWIIIRSQRTYRIGVRELTDFIEVMGIIAAIPFGEVTAGMRC